MRRVDVDDPDADGDPAHRVLYRGEPFTGEVAEYVDGQMVYLDVYVEGIRDGLSPGRFQSSPYGVIVAWRPDQVSLRTRCARRIVGGPAGLPIRPGPAERASDRDEQSPPIGRILRGRGHHVMLPP